VGGRVVFEGDGRGRMQGRSSRNFVGPAKSLINNG